MIEVSTMRQILCYGDSNTYGLVPKEHARYPWDIRWTGRLNEKLGLQQYRVIEENAVFTSDGNDIFTYLKLRIIAAALNEGWEPQFTEDEERWYPWFTLWTEEELSEKSDEWKADRHLISTGDYAGFAFAYSNYAPSRTDTNFGSRLCFKSEALATYCGKQFISLWADFNLIKK